MLYVGYSSVVFKTWLEKIQKKTEGTEGELVSRETIWSSLAIKKRNSSFSGDVSGLLYVLPCVSIIQRSGNMILKKGKDENDTREILR